MNEANQISATTSLYGFIAESAQSNRFSVTLNRLFKAHGDDAMMIPMNIRDDDFYFTLTNMKKSQLKGAVISPEFQGRVMEIVDEAGQFAEHCGLCDVVLTHDGLMRGDLVLPAAIEHVVTKAKVKRVAVIGNNAFSGAVAKALHQCEVAMFDPYVESLQQLQHRFDLDIDINRLAENLPVDLSSYDMVMDFSDLPDLTMICALPSLALDLKNTHETSALRQRCETLDTAYSGYDALLNDLTTYTYAYLKEYA